MAGPAEAGEAFAMIIVEVGLGVIGLAVALSVWRRWWRVSLGALTACLLLSLLFSPWTAFISVSSEDPDVLYWARQWRTVSILWLCCVFGCIAASVLIRRRKSPMRGASDAS